VVIEFQDIIIGVCWEGKYLSIRGGERKGKKYFFYCSNDSIEHVDKSVRKTEKGNLVDNNC